MPHPNGSMGNALPVVHSFAQTYAHVGRTGVAFLSTTGETITATQGFARDGVTPTIVFQGQNHVHGRVCAACWGYVTSCTGERIGQAVAPLDLVVP